jgi:DNA-binding MarR family transcriptional regulator
MQSQRKKMVFLTASLLEEHEANFPETFDRDSILIMFALRALAQRINDYASVWLSPLGINAAKYNYLSALFFSPERQVTLNTLSNMIHTSNAAVTSMIRSLEAEGLVEKLQNAADGRSYVVRLTTKGAKRTAQAVPIHCQAIQRGLKKLSARDRKELVRLLALVNLGFEESFEAPSDRPSGKIADPANRRVPRSAVRRPS